MCIRPVRETAHGQSDRVIHQQWRKGGGGGALSTNQFFHDIRILLRLAYPTLPCGVCHWHPSCLSVLAQCPIRRNSDYYAWKRVVTRKASFGETGKTMKSVTDNRLPGFIIIIRFPKLKSPQHQLFDGFKTRDPVRSG